MKSNINRNVNATINYNIGKGPSVLNNQYPFSIGGFQQYILWYGLFYLELPARLSLCDLKHFMLWFNSKSNVSRFMPIKFQNISC